MTCKWLITMVSKSLTWGCSIVPLPNGLNGLYMGDTNDLLRGFHRCELVMDVWMDDYPSPMIIPVQNMVRSGLFIFVPGSSFKKKTWKMGGCTLKKYGTGNILVNGISYKKPWKLALGNLYRNYRFP